MSQPDRSLKSEVASHRTTALQLERLELREIQMPLLAPFETSFGRATTRTMRFWPPNRVWNGALQDSGDAPSRRSTR